MARSSQGIRSSRIGPIKKSDRNKLKKLDRMISRLNKSLPLNLIINISLAKKQWAMRESADKTRHELRLWMKSKDKRNAI